MKKKDFKHHPFLTRLTHFLLFFLTRWYRVKANISDDVKNIDEPYLLLSNHVGSYDPFLLSHYIKKQPHFVSSDAVMRDPKLGFLFKHWGVIPKKKNVRDSQVIRDMISVVKKGGAIGLFPEGTRTWTGTSLYYDEAIGKLAKLLKVPVITAKMKGMQLTNPRWGTKNRRVALEIDYEMIFTKEELANASTTEIYEKIKEKMHHDEVDWQRAHMHEIISDHRAEFIDYVIFLCEECESIGKIKSNGNQFECQQCGRKTFVNKYGFFENTEGKAQRFDNIRDTYEWQREVFETFIEKHFRNKTFAPLFSDDNMLIYQEKNNKMELIGKATLSFYINRIVIKYDGQKQVEFPLTDIQVLNPQFHERIEVKFRGKNYRFVGEKPGVSGLKWEIATSKIWELTGEGNKRSTYLLG